MANFFSKFIGSSHKKTNKGKVSSLKLNWIVRGELAVGPIPLDEARQLLLVESGIRSILTLCSEEEGTPPEKLLVDLSWERIALPDSHYSESIALADLSRAVDRVHEYIQTSSPLYVHCIAGMERSPTICVAYLYKHKGMKLWEALNWVKQANPRTNILDSQLKAIQQLSI